MPFTAIPEQSFQPQQNHQQLNQVPAQQAPRFIPFQASEHSPQAPQFESVQPQVSTHHSLSTNARHQPAPNPKELEPKESSEEDGGEDGGEDVSERLDKMLKNIIAQSLYKAQSTSAKSSYYRNQNHERFI